MSSRSRMWRILRAENLTAAIIGTIVLAIMVQIVAFICMPDFAPTTKQIQTQASIEAKQAKMLLAKNKNAFNGLGLGSALDEIRAESDRVRQARMDLSMSRATTAEQRAALAKQHQAMWNRLASKRALRHNVVSQSENIIHGLLMIYDQQVKLDQGIGL